jgi:L,D-transpeptidase YcbB
VVWQSKNTIGLFESGVMQTSETNSLARTVQLRKNMPSFLCLGLSGVLFLAACADVAVINEQKRKAQEATVAGFIEKELAGQGSITSLTGVDATVVGGIVERVYKARGSLPIWTPNYGRNLLATLQEVKLDGLNPNKYRVKEIEGKLQLFSASKEMLPKDVAALDVLLTRAFVQCGFTLAVGELNPIEINEDWALRKKKNAEAEEEIVDALEGGLRRSDPGKALRELAPQEDEYLFLRQSLQRFSEIELEWKPIARASRKEVRGRLALIGFLPSPRAKELAFTKALKSFQSAYGVATTGKIDKATLAELNVPFAERIRQIKVNLERLRWLPRELGDDHVFVNVANFSLGVYHKTDPVMKMRVVVGKDTKQTPLFSNYLTQIVVNPFWNVPQTIVLEEILPKLQKDPTYAEKKNLKIFRRKGTEKQWVDPKEVDWTEFDENHFPFEVEQEPGPTNPLGSLEFIFPNTFAVYMHGSPETWVFKRNVRAFSHGCIRIEKPLQLAEYVLKGQWTREKLLKAIKEGKERTIKVPLPIKVHVFYRTAWVGEGGMVNFRKDIYNWDTPIWLALSEKALQ